MKKRPTALPIRILVTAILILIQVAVYIALWMWLINYSVLLSALLPLLSLAIVVYIAGKNEPSAYKIGWIIIIMLFPVLGGLMYLAFGNKRPVKKEKTNIEKYMEEYEKYKNPNEALKIELAEYNPRLAGTINYLQETGDFPASRCASVKYHSLGDDALPDLLEELEKAEDFIFMEYFIINRGRMWDSIYEILKKKAEAGLDVRLIYDDVGCLNTLEIDFSDKMEKVGIKCFAFNRFRPLMSISVNHRDHRKITVIDGKVAFTGGYNLADEYINEIEKFGHWKDSGLKITGDPVINFTLMFLEMWNGSRHEDKDIEKFLYRDPTGATCEGSQEGTCIVPYGETPFTYELIGQNTYMDIINQAKDYVYIFTPYLIIDMDMINALTFAAKRGVDVRIVTPGIPDKKMVYHVTRSYYPQLMEDGVKIYKYTPGFMHAKSFISDDKLSVVGTINLDYRSLCLHFECGVLLYGGPVIKDIKDDFEKTLAQSQRVDPETFHKKKRWHIFDHLIRLFAPLL